MQRFQGGGWGFSAVKHWGTQCQGWGWEVEAKSSAPCTV